MRRINFRIRNFGFWLFWAFDFLPSIRVNEGLLRHITLSRPHLRYRLRPQSVNQPIKQFSQRRRLIRCGDTKSRSRISESRAVSMCLSSHVRQSCIYRTVHALCKSERSVKGGRAKVNGPVLPSIR